MSWLQRLRIFLGCPNAQDRRDAEAEMWRNIRTTVHHDDLRSEPADEITRRERPSKKW